MHTHQHLFASLSALALVCALPVAQAPVSTAPVTATPGLQQGHGLRVDGEGLLGCGTDYLVRFDRDGAHFTPVLGRDAPAVAPLQITLQSIRRGATTLSCDLQDAPALAGDTAIYDRSPQVRERYELRDTGMEHSFVFDALPGRGDLVVRCRLGGLGELAVPAADGGLDFVRDGQRLVHMGTVTGIDHNGVRARGTIRRDGDCVELSLPASFVDRAAFPLVLDPFVSNALPISASAQYDSASHVAWQAQEQRWLCVFQRSVSNQQTDVMIRSLSPSGLLGALVPVASVAGTFSRAPRIAYHSGSNRCLVVYQQGTSEFTFHTIEGAVVDGNLAAVTTFQVAGTTFGNCATPDLSGDPTGAGQGVIVYAVRSAPGGIRLRSYTLGATGVPTLGGQVTVSSQATAARPRVSKSAAMRLAVTFEAKPNAYYLAFLQAVSRTGVMQGSTVTLVNPSGPDLRRPDIDGDGDEFLMACESQRGVGDRDIRITQWNWSGSNFNLPTVSADVAATIAVDESNPTVALLGAKYAVAWEQATGFLASNVQIRSYSRSGCRTCGTQVAVPFPGLQREPALASSFASGATDGMALLLFTQAAVPFPPEGGIYGCQWSTHAPVTPTVLSPGCGSGMTLSLVGSPGIGNRTFGFSVSTNDAQATLGAFLLGIGLATPRLPCGTCLIVDAVATNLAVLTGGAAGYPLPLPCDQSLIGFPIQVQAATIGSVQNVCPALGTLSVSQALGFSVVE
jgi:hypothetical protein